VDDSIDRTLAALHDAIASTVQAAGPWAVPMVVAIAGLLALFNRDRMVSPFGVFLVIGTAAVILVVLGFQNGRI
jgi:hypothetical protein